VVIYEGRYGPYIKFASKNITVPRDRDPQELTLEEAVALIDSKPGAKKGTGGGRRGGRRAAGAKPAAKAGKRAGKKAAGKRAGGKRRGGEPAETEVSPPSPPEEGGAAGAPVTGAEI
jgi:DNA topoisomerase-1